MIFSHADMTDARSARVIGGNAVIISRCCPGKDSPNEDSAGVFDYESEGGLLVVADGVGGHLAGDLASRMAVNAIADSLDAMPADRTGLECAVIDGIHSGNRRIMALGIGAATTLTVAEIHGDTVRNYHVGDSAMLLISRYGHVKWQSVAHSPVGYAVEAGTLDEEEALYHEDRHIVSNVVGSDEMHIDAGPILKLSDRDTVLVASDGLFDNLRIDEIGSYFRKGRLAESVARMAEDCRARMLQRNDGQPSKPDDTTILAYRRSSPRRGSKNGRKALEIVTQK